MIFDLADLEIVQEQGNLEDLIVHEMAHVLGFGAGPLWDNNLQGRNSQQPRFTGSQANREYQRIFGFNAQDSVPVEATGGPGTAYAHWEMGSFPGELMIGSIILASVLSIVAVMEN
ncbi:MAG: hypothetical protein EA365_12400 [Gloeocapsa sp. DLM2.Bin57]|nr:MAG: hypothetical protein EA365_12400 [Gloeocapsa sp. DLM2.Bin57]